MSLAYVSKLLIRNCLYASYTIWIWVKGYIYISVKFIGSDFYEKIFLLKIAFEKSWVQIRSIEGGEVWLKVQVKADSAPHSKVGKQWINLSFTWIAPAHNSPNKNYWHLINRRMQLEMLWCDLFGVSTVFRFLFYIFHFLVLQWFIRLRRCDLDFWVYGIKGILRGPCRHKTDDSDIKKTTLNCHKG